MKNYDSLTSFFLNFFGCAYFRREETMKREEKILLNIKIIIGQFNERSIILEIKLDASVVNIPIKSVIIIYL